MTQAPVIFVVAGEPSGDQHAAMLGEALLRRAPVHLCGVGQQGMRQAGFELLYDSSDWGGIGICQSAGRYPRLVGRAHDIARWLVRHQPDLLVLVDFGAFNVWLARKVRQRAAIPVLYYFPPRSWNRQASGYRRLAGVIDHWVTPFDWSAEILRREGLDATWVGHPVVDRIQPAPDRAALRRELGLDPDRPLLGLLPGSRRYEVGPNAPQMLGAARIMRQHFPHLQVAVSVAPSIPRSWLNAMVARCRVPDAHLMSGTADIARAADLAITSAGTATLDLAAAGCPMVVTYRGTLLMRTEEIFRRMRRLTIALPNIIAERRIVPEIVAFQATAANLAATAMELLGDPERLARTRQELLALRERLGAPGVSDRVADIALQMLGAAKRAAADPATCR